MTDTTVTIIEARQKGVAARLLSLWQYRAFYPFLLKEITIRKFRGTVLGFWWLIIRPLIPAAILIVMFTLIVPIETPGLPYVIFFLSGFTTWQFFQACLVFLPRTMWWMRSLMRRAYFPRMLVPLASVGPPLIELLIILGLFVTTLLYFGVTAGTTYLRVGWEMLWFPVCLLLSLLLSLGIGMVMSIIALFFRDIRYSVRYFAQILFLLTPVFYPVTLVPEPWRWIIFILNPMAQIVEVSRWSLTGAGELDPLFFALAVATSLLIVALCVGFFLRAETYLADEI